jgi:hypothetical protein
MKLIGIKAVKMTSGKNEGKTGYTYYFEKDFTDYEKQNATCYGSSVSSEFSYTDFGVSVGDNVNPVYDKGFQDKAVLVNLIPFKK